MSPRVHLFVQFALQFLVLGPPCLLVPYPYSPLLWLIVGIPASWATRNAYCKIVTILCSTRVCRGRMSQRGGRPIVYVCDTCSFVHDTHFNARMSAP